MSPANKYLTPEELAELRELNDRLISSGLTTPENKRRIALEIVHVTSLEQEGSETL